MCTWAPTPRIVASFREAFPHVLGPRRQSVLLGSNEPLTVDPESWRSRLRSPAVQAHLGHERAANIQPLLERIALVPPPEELSEGELNRDLFPRDEFLTP